MTEPEQPHRRESDQHAWGKKIGVVTLVWIVSSLCVGAGSWYISQAQSEHRTTEIRREVRQSINPLVCLFRGLVIPARARSLQTEQDRKQTQAAQLRAANAVRTDDRILRNLITAPPTFDCSTFS